LIIYGTGLEGAAFGNCISDVLQNATHLQRLKLGMLNSEVVVRSPRFLTGSSCNKPPFEEFLPFLLWH
jgi:hypothetical protein